MTRVALRATTTSARCFLVVVIALMVVSGAVPGIAAGFPGSPGNDATALITTDVDGAASDCPSDAAATSADGRYVAFSSCAHKITPDSVGTATQVYLRDRQTGSTSLVSVNAAGDGEGNCDSGGQTGYHYVAISATGRYVVFASCATDLTASHPPGVCAWQVYRRDMVAQSTELMSTGQGSGYGCSGYPFQHAGSVAVSADGDHVVFNTDHDTGQPYVDQWDVFERNVSEGTTLRVSSNGCVKVAGGLDVSDDGRYVVFGNCGKPPNCPQCIDRVGYTYKRDMSTGALEMVSVDAAGGSVATGDLTFGNYAPVSMSADGRYVTFGESGAYNSTNLYVRDTQLDATHQVGPATHWNGDRCSGVMSLSDDGRHVAFSCSIGSTGYEAYLEDLRTGITELVSASYYETESGCDSRAMSLSGNGQQVLFRSCAENITAVTFDPHILQVYARDATLRSGRGNGPMRPSEMFGRFNPAEPACVCSTGWEGDPVNTSSGDYSESQVDATVPGRGPGLKSVRTYDSLNVDVAGAFGRGWSYTYGAHLGVDTTTGGVTVFQGAGAEVHFAASDTSGGFDAPPRVTATLAKAVDGTYRFTTREPGNQLAYEFDAAGRLTAITDRNGNATTVSYPDPSHLVVSDESGRRLVYQLSGGRITALTDPLGQVTRFSYDSAGNLAQAADPLGRTTRYTYDSEHRLTTWQDPRGATLTNAYDSSGRVVQQTDRAGRVTAFGYDDAAHTTTVTDPLGAKTVDEYRDGFLVSRTTAEGTSAAATWKYAYDPDTGAQTAVQDPKGQVTTRSVDGRGNVLSATDPLNGRTTYTYNGRNDVTSSTDPTGVATTLEYDANGNRIARTTPLDGGGQAKWSYSYGAGPTAGDLERITNPNGQVTAYAYDNAGNQVAVTDPLGRTTTRAYDDGGRLIKTTSPSGRSTHFAYDAVGQRTETVDPSGQVERYEYDANGNETARTDAGGHITTYAYNADDQQTHVVRPEGDVWVTEYDAGGNVTLRANGSGHATSYTYDPQHRVAAATGPNGRTTTYEYDASGNRTATTNPSGRRTTYTYDAGGKVVGIRYSDGQTPNVTQAYDAAGRRTSLNDGSGSTGYAYDALGRLTSRTDGAGKTISYTYDPAGNTTSITYPNGRTVMRAFNGADELTSVTDWLGNTTRFSYDSDGHLQEENFPGSVRSRWTYDASGRVAGIADHGPAGDLANYGYSRDALGRISAMTAAGPLSESTAFSHDGNGRVAGEGPVTYGYSGSDDPTTYGNRVQYFNAASEVQTSTAKTTSGGAPGRPTNGGLPRGTGGSGAWTAVEGFGLAPEGASDDRRGVVAAVSAHVLGKGRKLTARLGTRKAGESLLAFISSESPKHGGQSSPKPETPGLAWKSVVRAKGAGGAVSVWRSRVTRSTSQATVTTQLGRKGAQGLLTVVALSPGVSVRSAGKRTGSGGPPRLTISAPSGSQIWAVGHDSASGAVRKPLAGNRIVDQVHSGRLHAASWVQTADPRRDGSIAVGARTPSSTRWSLAAVIVKVPAVSSAAVHTPGDQNGQSRAARSISRRTLDALASGHRAFTYNSEGDRTAVSGNGATVPFAYDQADRLTAVGTGVRYAYDGDGLRTSETVDGVGATFTWDSSGDMPLLLEDGGASYIYGPGGRPIEQVTGGTPSYLLGDQQGSTRLLTNDAGSVAGAYAYDAWGQVKGHVGAATTSLQYNGQYTDDETGLQYLRARYYDASTGQFLSVDPAAHLTGAPYTYAENAPLNQSDPLGLWSFSTCVGICVGYDSAQGWGGGFGLGAGVQVGHVAVSTRGTSTIAYPHTGQLSWSGGALGIGGQIDAQPGRVVGGQVCVGVGLLAWCGSPNEGSSNATYKQANPMPMFENAHKQYMERLNAGALGTPADCGDDR